MKNKSKKGNGYLFSHFIILVLGGVCGMWLFYKVLMPAFHLSN